MVSDAANSRHFFFAPRKNSREIFPLIIDHAATYKSHRTDSPPPISKITIKVSKILQLSGVSECSLFRKFRLIKVPVLFRFGKYFKNLRRPKDAGILSKHVHPECYKFGLKRYERRPYRLDGGSSENKCSAVLRLPIRLRTLQQKYSRRSITTFLSVLSLPTH